MDKNGSSLHEKAISVTLKDNSEVIHSVVDVQLTGKEAGDANDLSSLIVQMKKAKEDVNDFLTSLVNADISNNKIEEKNLEEDNDGIDDDEEDDGSSSGMK